MGGVVTAGPGPLREGAGWATENAEHCNAPWPLARTARPPAGPVRRAGFLSRWWTSVRNRCELGGYRQGRCRAVTKLWLRPSRPAPFLRYRDRQGGAGEGPLCPLALHAGDDTTAVENGTKIMTNVSEPAALGGPSARRGGRRRLVFILLAIIAVIAVVLAGGALAYATQFEGRSEE